jgi:hypothetical protein
MLNVLDLNALELAINQDLALDDAGPERSDGAVVGNSDVAWGVTHVLVQELLVAGEVQSAARVDDWHGEGAV